MLECPNLPLQHYREVLRTLPEEILPHVPRPLVYCDLLSDGYAKGGVEALLALKGLFVLMTQYNLEYPKFYPRLYNLLDGGGAQWTESSELCHGGEAFPSRRRVSLPICSPPLPNASPASPSAPPHPARCTRLRARVQLDAAAPDRACARPSKAEERRRGGEWGERGRGRG